MAVDFTKQMKRDFTILAPDIFPTHMELLQEVFALHGYHVEVLHDEGPAVIAAGLKYLHNDMCYPATCAIGQQLYALTSGTYDPHRVALIQFQTGGGCRASNYIFLLRKALHNMGMDYVPVISLSFGGYEHYSGFKITPLMLFAGLRSLIYGDMLMLLKNQCLPYESNPGDTRKVIQKWIAELTGQFRRKQGLTPKAMQKNLRAMAKDFHEIPRTPKDCTKVGIVGEIYVKYSSFGNNGLEQFLLSQGCEYMVPGVLGFFQYCFANIEMDHKYYGGSRLKLLIGRKAEQIAGAWEDWLIEALKPYPEFVPPVSFEKIKALADRVIDRGVKMGEGWLLPGEAGYRRRGQPSCTDDAEHIQHHAEPARARKGQHTPGRDCQCAQNAQRGIRREFPVYIGIRLPLFQCRRAQQKQQAHQHGKRNHRHGAPTGALRGAEEIARSPGNRRQIRQPK